jgi:hypothetical protein
MDRPPASNAVELDSDAAWEEFQLLSTQSMSIVTEETAQARLQAGTAASLSAERRRRLHDVTARMESSRRACPKPSEWFYLYQLLLDGAAKRRTDPPPIPPIEGPAWRATSAAAKKMCLQSHIEWAHANGLLEVVASFLDGLPEDRWLHLNNQ